ncbi:hypothetical protein FHS15_001189 [Paenibacillus castaneae]|uniref:DNA-binding anti-repressor SinI n=1 Tax=Paenibacillus castaneae TaxID=474957 RepID=UPI0011AEFAD2|nr:DNA-binding anti-repressor SinI [Paenibacillus castaneae]NIK76082.1 hypothetical protein [Paenibacillus castaneae]
MMLTKLEDNHELDSEWVALIMNARAKGFSKEDIRKVLLCIQESAKGEMEEETAV